MKFTELTKEQQEHFLKMIDKVGEPPEGTTHVDLLGDSKHGWLIQENGEFTKFYSLRDMWVDYKEDPNEPEVAYELPDKPWSISEDILSHDHTGDLSVTQLKICCENLLDVISQSQQELEEGCLIVEVSDIKAQINELTEVLYGKDEV